MSEAGDLSVEPQARLALLLGDLELALLILADGLNADLLAEGGKDLVFCLIDDLREAANPLCERIMIRLSL